MYKRFIITCTCYWNQIHYLPSLLLTLHSDCSIPHSEVLLLFLQFAGLSDWKFSQWTKFVTSSRSNNVDLQYCVSRKMFKWIHYFNWWRISESLCYCFLYTHTHTKSTNSFLKFVTRVIIFFANIFVARYSSILIKIRNDVSGSHCLWSWRANCWHLLNNNTCIVTQQKLGHCNDPNCRLDMKLKKVRQHFFSGNFFVSGVM